MRTRPARPIVGEATAIRRAAADAVPQQDTSAQDSSQSQSSEQQEQEQQEQQPQQDTSEQDSEEEEQEKSQTDEPQDRKAKAISNESLVRCMVSTVATMPV